MNKKTGFIFIGLLILILNKAEIDVMFCEHTYSYFPLKKDRTGMIYLNRVFLN